MDQIRKIVVLSAFVLLNIRGLLGSFGIDTLWLTILINLMILASVDYKKVKSDLLILPLFALLLLYNKEILGPINILAFVYLLRDISLKRLGLINASLFLLFFVLMFFLLTFGVIHSREWVMPKGVAYDLGFANPNAVGSSIYILLLNLYLLFYDKSKYILPILILVITQTVYHYSLSRTAWIGGMILVLVHFLVTFRLIRPSLRYFIGILPFLLMGVILYFTVHLWEYPLIDQLFSGRLSIYSRMLENMSAVNWLIGIRSLAEEPMDSSFLMLLFNGGIMLFLLFLGTFLRSMIKHFDFIKPYLPIILSILASGIVENIFSAASSISVIFWLLIFQQKEQVYKSKIVLAKTNSNVIE